MAFPFFNAIAGNREQFSRPMRQPNATANNAAIACGDE